MIKFSDDTSIPTARINLETHVFDLFQRLASGITDDESITNKELIISLLHSLNLETYVIYKPNPLIISRYTMERSYSKELIYGIDRAISTYIQLFHLFEISINNVCIEFVKHVKLINHKSSQNVERIVTNLLTMFSIKLIYNSCLNPETYVYYEYLLNSVSSYKH